MDLTVDVAPWAHGFSLSKASHFPLSLSVTARIISYGIDHISHGYLASFSTPTLVRKAKEACLEGLTVLQTTQPVADRVKENETPRVNFY